MNKIFIYLFAFLVIVILILNNWYEEFLVRKNKFNKYLYKYSKTRLEEKGFFSDKYWAKMYVSKNIPECKVAKLLYRTKNPDTIKNIALPDRCLIKCSSYRKLSFFYQKNQNPKKEEKNRRKIVKKCKKFLNLPSKLELFLKKLIRIDEPQYLYNDKSIIIEEILPIRREIGVHMIKNKICFIIEKDNKNKIIRNIYDSNGNIMDKSMSYHIEISKHDRKKLLDFNLIKKICERFQNKYMFEYVRIDFTKINNQLYFQEFTFTSNACIGKLSPKLDKYIHENFLKFSN
jgi:hypothetical protein